MSQITRRSHIPMLLLALIVAASPAAARHGDNFPGDQGWEAGDRLRPPDMRRDRGRNDDSDGRVNVARFVAPNLQPGTLGHGSITVASVPGALADPQEVAVYESAVTDQLIHAGYDTAVADSSSGQVVELRLVHNQVQPKAPPRKPVSGEMAVGVSNRGTMTAMALNVDLSKPKGALISTRLELRIRDRASNAVLWEGRAQMATRDGDSQWDRQAIARKLASALFDDFPNRSDGT